VIPYIKILFESRPVPACFFYKRIDRSSGFITLGFLISVPQSLQTYNSSSLQGLPAAFSKRIVSRQAEATYKDQLLNAKMGGPIHYVQHKCPGRLHSPDE
jgi:hypothetical protein